MGPDSEKCGNEGGEVLLGKNGALEFGRVTILIKTVSYVPLLLSSQRHTHERGLAFSSSAVIHAASQREGTKEEPPGSLNDAAGEQRNERRRGRK